LPQFPFMLPPMTHPLLKKLLFGLACILSGWIAAFAMAPVSCWPLMFVGISGLYWLYTHCEKPMHAWLAGFLFALGYFVTGLWWIGNALLVDGNDFRWVWPISVIGLPTLLGLFTGTYLAIARMISDPRTLKGMITFAFFLTVSEWTRGHAFTGFPWNLYGYTWADTLPMAQGFYLFGAFGMTFITLLWAATPGLMLVHTKPWNRKGRLAIPVILTMLMLFLWGQNRLADNPTKYDPGTGIVVVQPNIAQTMKWDPKAVQDNFDKIISLSKGATFNDPQPRSVFVVWPETAIGPSVYTVGANVDLMQKVLKSYKGDSYLVTGILKRDEDASGNITFSNSIAFLDNQIELLNQYSKTHLVPFGEFIPFQKWIPLKPVVEYKGFEPGKGATTFTKANVPPFSPLICYEIIFPDQVTPKSGVRPQWIVNVTNDGWYGDSAGPHQHFAQTRLRAIEEGLPVVRSANTGISGIIDPLGRVIDQGDIFHEATIVSLLPRSIEKPSPWWPWILQPLLFFASISWMLLSLRTLVRR